MKQLEHLFESHRPKNAAAVAAASFQNGQKSLGNVGTSLYAFGLELPDVGKEGEGRHALTDGVAALGVEVGDAKGLTNEVIQGAALHEGLVEELRRAAEAGSDVVRCYEEAEAGLLALEVAPQVVRQAL